MRRKMTAILLTFALLLSSILTSAAVIYEDQSVTALSKGVTQTVNHRFTDGGWYKIYTLRVDLNVSGISLETLISPDGVNTRESVLSLAKKSNALAAMNADFFQPSGSGATRASALGAVVRDGRLLTTPARGTQMATVAMDGDKTVTMGMWDQYITLTAPNGETDQIVHFNKYHDDGGLVLFDGGWDKASPGAPMAQVEMVVTDGVVTGFRFGEGDVPFEKDQYVIDYIGKGENNFLTENFQQGDEVAISTWFEPDPSSYKMAVGGGTLLLQGGADAPVTHSVTGTHPRTAMGVDKTGKIVYLVAVDGRQSASAGMTMAELRNYMRDLGCWNAINFDGGGSTTYVSKEPRENAVSLKNVPSDGSMRLVPNGVGVVSDAPVGGAAILDAYFGEGLYAGEKNDLFIKVYDEYYHDLAVSAGQVTLRMTGVDGYTEGGAIYPAASGSAVITATYGGVTQAFHVYIRPARQQPDTDVMRLPPDAAPVGTKVAVLGYAGYKNILGRLYAYRALENANAEADAIMAVSDLPADAAERVSVPVISGGYYYAAYKQDNLLIQLDTRKAGLLKSDPAQWQRFLKLIDEAAVSNVIITLGISPATGFTDPHELALFKKILEQKLVDTGKNVFVAYDSSHNEVSIANGIRYIGLKGAKDISALNFTSLRECSYLVVTSQNGYTSYQIKSILNLPV
ncbi:hypothetical protein FACS189492_1210 [Clostridia bacterium]|nr:hypothetical protein FACS189492_1210 [Clostridia bacterium]